MDPGSLPTHPSKFTENGGCWNHPLGRKGVIARAVCFTWLRFQSTWPTQIHSFFVLNPNQLQPITEPDSLSLSNPFFSLLLYYSSSSSFFFFNFPLQYLPPPYLDPGFGFLASRSSRKDAPFQASRRWKFLSSPTSIFKPPPLLFIYIR